MGKLAIYTSVSIMILYHSMKEENRYLSRLSHPAVLADGALTRVAAKVCFAGDLLTEKNCLKLPKAA